DYDVKYMYVCKQSLEERGLTVDDLLDLKWEDEDEDWAEKDSIILVDRSEMKTLMTDADVVLSF
ncbi:MAG TPA: sulfurtransferase TusC, partial [Ectothiorhodospiraceae bacterium]|nr:sulfurtransferase TusC [Ectothiorhodospiraceae bacterium]